MGIPVHRHSDSRVCGATTVVSNQSTVYANGLLIAVDTDPDSHGAGALIASAKNVYIEGLLVVLLGDNAQPDSLCPLVGPPHCNPYTTSASPNVYCARG